MRKRKLCKKGLALVLTFAMITGLLPVAGVPKEVQAETATEKTIAGLGVSVIADPTAPSANTNAWQGSYVYFGNYDADGDETAEPIKYRVLDANTTRFSADDGNGNKASTMLLDSDSILYYQKFDEDGTANTGYSKANDWAGSDVKASLNGDDFLEKEGVFTVAEKNAIATSTIGSHALTTDSTAEGAVNVASWTQSAFANYVPLTGEKVFLLDAEDVSNNAYGYSMTDESCNNRKKTGSSAAYWWLRSADDDDNNAGFVHSVGFIIDDLVNSGYPGVSPALNLNLSSVIFTSVISGTSGETGAEYKLTLKDSDMSVATSNSVTRSGNVVTVPYSITGNNSANATQVSVLITDKEYTAGNTNGAEVLAYEKLAVDSFSTSGTGTYTLPNTLSGKKAGTDYHVYILAEDVNEEKETDYASEPVEIHLWEAPTVSAMNFGTNNIIDPAKPNHANDAWTGCYVYFGNYDVATDGEAEPVKYRVLDAETTDFSESTKTMLLDCDSVLEQRMFDADSNVWADSDIKTYLNGDFLAGTFSALEQNAIIASTKAVANASDGNGMSQANYVALNGEKVFLLDAKEATRTSYGYRDVANTASSRIKKLGSGAAYWWLRSADDYYVDYAGYAYSVGFIGTSHVLNAYPGVSPALNLNLSSVIFTSANAVSKSSTLTSGSSEIGTTNSTEWKLTLKDSGKKVSLTEGRSVTKASDGTITVPYTYTDASTTDAEKVNQISVMITDKAYDGAKTANEQEAKILYYGALDSIKNAEGTESTVAEATSGTGNFSLPSGLTGTLGTDYYIYLLAEHVNTDDSKTTGVDENLNTDYASEPKEVTAILDEVDTVAVPSIDTPIAEKPLKEEITISSTVVAEKATLTWKKNNTKATGNAEWKTTYQVYVTLTAADGYAFTDTTGATLNENSVDTESISLNEDGTLTIACGEYTTATRKTEGATAPEVPTQFANYYTADNVLSSTELGTTAKVTLEGTTTPNPEEMKVEWSLANANNAAYDATPTATNIFKWTVKESEYADYDKDVAVLEGTVTIQNKDYTPVTITGENVTVTYDGEDTLDVSQYFTIDKNAGTPTYELLDTSDGDGTLAGTTLTMNTLGTFVIKVSTPINGVYDKGEHTLTITVNKAAPDVNTLPTVADRIYHPTTVLADTDITGGTVKDVSGNSLAGTWSWKEADVPTVDNDGYVAVFTPKDTVHYESVEKTISVNVSKATPYIKTLPTATAITYGDTLGVSTLSGGVAQYSKEDETSVEGTFTWKEKDTKPTVADSDKTEYALVFIPTDKDNYNSAEEELTVTVEKAEVVPNKPESTMNTVYTNDTVGKVTLPESWVWQDSDKTKALEVGKEVTATAIYNGADKGNYVVESVEVAITRDACTHTWDAGKVTKETSATETGEKTYTCTVCKETKTEEIPALGAPKVGTKKTSDDGKATYKVTTSDITKGTVTYVVPTDAKATTVTVPDTVVIDGVTYKITAIEKNAFKNNKYIKKVIIGNNIITIGDNAFYGCKKLKTVKFGKNVKTIGNKAFYKCSALTKITIPSKVKTIGKSAFYGCKKLKTVTIGKSVTKIGAKAFYGCSKIKTLTIKSTKLTTKKIGSKAFTKTPKKMIVKVPKKKFKAYKSMFIKRGVNKQAKFKKI